MTANAQLTFDGREVLQVKLDIPGMGTIDLPSEKDLHNDDILTCTVQFIVDKVEHGSKHDRDGIETDLFGQTFKLKTLKRGFSIDSVSTRRDRDAEWERNHGATG